MAPHADNDVQLSGVTDTSSVVIPDPVLSKNPTYSTFSIDDVLPHRQKSAPMPRGVAAFGSADMFKSKGCYTKPKAKKWDHRITAESASRNPSSLKGAMKYFRPDMISLCGGLPSSNYFPFDSISTKVPQSPHFSEQETAMSGIQLTTGKHDIQDGKSLYDLHIALNYGQSMGPPQFIRFLTEHTEIVHKPKYSDWDICVTVGSTSALDIALRMFCARGDYLITEEYSFSSAIETALPMGLKMLGIKMDADGLLPSHLDEVLTNWDSSARGGASKPFVLYTVPTGQNPTSSTQSLHRRQEIYAVAEKHDLIILEDEPYYFLQMEQYDPNTVHECPSQMALRGTTFAPSSPSDFLNALIPSYLSLDTTGRVVRMDSFSKIIAPGARTGWVTAPTQITERFIRHQEVSSQTPSGFAMSCLYQLLEEQWGHKGFLEWLMFIRAEYTRRRDIIVRACEDFVPTSVATWVAPRAGMFHWIKVNAKEHPRVKAVDIESVSEREMKDFLAEIEEKIFLAGVEKGVLVARGSWFKAEKDNERAVDVVKEVNGQTGSNSNGVESSTKVSPAGAGSTDLYFRMTFAAEAEDKIQDAVKRFGEALKTEFGLDG